PTIQHRYSARLIIYPSLVEMVVPELSAISSSVRPDAHVGIAYSVGEPDRKNSSVYFRNTPDCVEAPTVKVVVPAKVDWYCKRDANEQYAPNTNSECSVPTHSRNLLSKTV